ncbi:unnamed protein product [Pedinophyceae sp. YPF-701]|nr:unnamed protein product [Pedinophyceae sp. YPF-701]
MSDAGRPAHPTVVYYCSGHGFGHVTRSFDIADELLKTGCTLHLVCAAKNAFALAPQHPNVQMRTAVFDAGCIQKTAFDTDAAATLRAYREIDENRMVILERERAFLRDVGADVVVTDVASIPCESASAAGIPSVVVGNFTWDFIYQIQAIQLARERGAGNGSGGVMGAVCEEWGGMLTRISQGYAHATVCLQLGLGVAPMPAFRRVQPLPYVCRPVKVSATEIRRQLGVPDEDKIVLVTVGGQHMPETVASGAFDPGEGWVCCVTGRMPEGAALPPRFKFLPPDIDLPSVVAASACVVGKNGFGTCAECLSTGTPHVATPRNYFAEEPYLRASMAAAGASVEMPLEAFEAGDWMPYIQRATQLRPRPRKTSGGKMCAALIVEVAGGAWQPREEDVGVAALHFHAWGLAVAAAARGEELPVPDWLRELEDRWP